MTVWYKKDMPLQKNDLALADSPMKSLTIFVLSILYIEDNNYYSLHGSILYSNK